MESASVNFGSFLRAMSSVVATIASTRKQPDAAASAAMKISKQHGIRYPASKNVFGIASRPGPFIVLTLITITPQNPKDPLWALAPAIKSLCASRSTSSHRNFASLHCSRSLARSAAEILGKPSVHYTFVFKHGRRGIRLLKHAVLAQRAFSTPGDFSAIHTPPFPHTGCVSSNIAKKSQAASLCTVSLWSRLGDPDPPGAGRPRRRGCDSPGFAGLRATFTPAPDGGLSHCRFSITIPTSRSASRRNPRETACEPPPALRLATFFLRRLWPPIRILVRLSAQRRASLKPEPQSFVLLPPRLPEVRLACAGTRALWQRCGPGL